MTNHQPRDVPITPKEFEEFKRQCQREGTEWVGQLINFRQRLPYSPNCLTSRALVESWNKKLLGEKPDHNPSYLGSNYSELRRGQTLREFYSTIDTVLRQLGIYREIKGKNHSGEIDQEEFCELIYPAYVRLRELGYNCYPDLTV